MLPSWLVCFIYLFFFIYLCCLAGSTSTGLSVQMLQKSIGYTTGSSLVLLTPPPSSGGGRGNMFGVQSGHPPKSLCLNFCYNSLTGKSVPQVDLQPSGQLRCALTSKGASINTMGKLDRLWYKAWDFTLVSFHYRCFLLQNVCLIH